MLGFSLQRRDASKIELFHVESGTRFVFLLASETVTDKYFVAPDLSSEGRLPDHAAIEELAILARKVAILLMPSEPPQAVVLLLPPPSLPAGTDELRSEGPAGRAESVPKKPDAPLQHPHVVRSIKPKDANPNFLSSDGKRTIVAQWRAPINDRPGRTSDHTHKAERYWTLMLKYHELAERAELPLLRDSYFKVATRYRSMAKDAFDLADAARRKD
jgi:hypothetical protein